VFGAAFFPWLAPLELVQDDIVSVHFKALLIGEDYIWSWGTRVSDQNNSERLKAKFNQCTFKSWPMSSERLENLESDHIPTLNNDARIDRVILTLMDGTESLGEIARKIAHQFPTIYSTWQEALTRVSQLSQRYCA
jgi:protein arginine N-methyltransferase 1